MASPKLDEILRQVDDLSLDDLNIVYRWVQKQRELIRLRESQDITEEFDVMREIRLHLQSKGASMPGADATLLACRHVQLSGSEIFNARQVNAVLLECDCKPSNTSTVMDSLRQRNLIEVKSPEETGKHKLFTLTQMGYTATVKILEASSKVIPYKNEMGG